jgi:hypothetical protein
MPASGATETKRTPIAVRSTPEPVVTGTQTVLTQMATTMPTYIEGRHQRVIRARISCSILRRIFMADGPPAGRRS